MADFDETNTGALWVHDKEGNERRPDRKGTLDVDGVKYWISGWLRTTRQGEKFLSLRVEKKKEQPPREGIAASLNPPAPAAPAAAAPAFDARSLYEGPGSLETMDEVNF